MDTTFTQLWYLQDNMFLLPKASVTVELLRYVIPAKMYGALQS